MPNPWDRGSARMLEELGFAALATTSAGFGRAIGKDDQEVSRDELVHHVADLVDQIGVPLNVDSEMLFPDQPGGITETVRLLAEAGASGCSIEDYDPSAEAIVDADAAVQAVSEAARACAEHGIVLTARCESHLYGGTDVEDTLRRLTLYREAGAGCVYAPGLSDAASIQRVLSEVGGPVNVLAIPGTPELATLAALGVRVSLGSVLFNAAYGTLKSTAKAFIQPSFVRP